MGTQSTDGARQARIAALGYDYEATPKRLRSSCELCGSTRFAVLNNLDRYGYRAPAMACLTCGLTFLNPVMTDAAYQDFYGRIYRPLVSAFHGRLINAETIQEEQQGYATALGDLLEPFMAASGGRRLLDIGGSTGVVARELVRRFGLAATVLDPAADELDWARKHGIETVSGFVEDYNPGSQKFDLIILCQTVDHLLSASASLAKIANLLAENGLFFVDIVDFRAAYLRAGGAPGGVKIDHPYYFTEDTIEPLLHNAGFDVVRKSYAADGLHVGYVCRAERHADTALPSKEAVREFFRELRLVRSQGS